MRIAVCDDEENALRQVRSVINKLSVVDEAEYYSDMDAFMERINTGIYYDIVMMDIDWNSRRTGIDCASQLYRLAPETKLIFFTGYSQRYIEAVFMKRTNIEGYLAKPVKQQALERLILKAVSDVRTSGEASMTVKQKGGTVTLPLAHIRYIESRGHNVIIHTIRENIEVYRTFSEIIKEMPPNYCICHRSYMVNFDFVRRIERGEVLLEGINDVIPVSKIRKKAFEQAYFDYVGDTLK